ncbi:MAG: hypothetical protein K6T59_16175, partial [Bryobacteraceae bacterium]|nr:hypothetical protein [Bryobacteraceae bacterium]
PAENVFGIGKFHLWVMGLVFSTSITILHLLKERNARFPRLHAIPIYVPEQDLSKVDHLKNQGALIKKLKPEWLSSLRLTPSDAPHYYRFEEGKVAESLSVGDYVHRLSSSPKGEHKGRKEGISSFPPARTSLPTQQPNSTTTGGKK